MVRIVPLEDDSDWVQSVQPRIAGMHEFADLPPEVVLDFSPASLAALAPVVAARAGDHAFQDAARAYAGETLMRIGGGRWVVTGDTPAAVRFDGALGLPEVVLDPLPPEGLAATARTVAAAVAERRRRHPGWVPAKHATPGLDRRPATPSAELDRWLAGQRSAFATWSAEHGGRWDFSAESLDTLEELVRAGGAIPAGLAEWYLGETLIRQADGDWTHQPGEPRPGDIYRGNRYVKRAAPKDTAAVPVVTLTYLAESPAGELRATLGRYAF